MRISGAHVEYNAVVEYWRLRCRSFEVLTAFAPATYSLMSGGDAQRVQAVRVNSGLFGCLGAAPALAAYGPARRAGRVDPVMAFRAERTDGLGHRWPQMDTDAHGSRRT